MRLRGEEVMILRLEIRSKAANVTEVNVEKKNLSHCICSQRDHRGKKYVFRNSLAIIGHDHK